MEGSRSGSEIRIDELTRRLAAIERRLETLEGWAVARDESRIPAPKPPPAVRVEPVRSGEGYTLPLVGRTLVALAGAFALRAMTEQGIFPQTVGAGLGVAYALIWILLADRSAAAGRRTGAMFHGVAAAIIAFPLLWESTVRFEVLSGYSSGAVLSLFTAVALLVAWRRGLRRLAGVVTFGAGATALALLLSTTMPILYGIVLLVLGMTTLWMGYVNGWRGPGWLAALFVDVGVLLMMVILRVGRPELIDYLAPTSLVALQISMMVAYLASFGVRTLWRGRELDPGEILQGVAVLVFGLGGATVVARAAGLPLVTLGMVNLLLGLGCYGVAFSVMDRQKDSRFNFLFYTTLALVLTVAGIGSLFGEPVLSLLLAVVALVAVWIGDVRSRATLSMHGAVYIGAAAIISGLAATSFGALAGPAASVSEPFTFSMLVVLVVAALCVWFRVDSGALAWGRLSRVPRVVILLVALMGIGGLLVNLIAPLLAGGAGLGAGSIAALRTAVLAVSAVVLAWLRRLPRLAETGLFVYPVLIAGGLKMLIEDLRAGQAATLFISLALYGAALIIAPRILGRAGRSVAQD